jgi:hypothetical protein
MIKPKLGMRVAIDTSNLPGTLYAPFPGGRGTITDVRPDLGYTSFHVRFDDFQHNVLLDPYTLSFRTGDIQYFQILGDNELLRCRYNILGEKMNEG